MPDDPRTKPLQEWNRLARENTENPDDCGFEGPMIAVRYTYPPKERGRRNRG